MRRPRSVETTGCLREMQTHPHLKRIVGRLVGIGLPLTEYHFPGKLMVLGGHFGLG